MIGRKPRGAEVIFSLAAKPLCEARGRNAEGQTSIAAPYVPELNRAAREKQAERKESESLAAPCV